MVGEWRMVRDNKGTGASNNHINHYVGHRIRLRRSALGMSQEILADALGITFQQVQKYESGLNKVSASRLYELSKTLSVSVTFFFEGFDGEKQTPAAHIAEDAPRAPWGPEGLSHREAMRLAQAYYQVKDLSVRKKVLELMHTIGVAYHGKDQVRESDDYSHG